MPQWAQDTIFLLIRPTRAMVRLPLMLPAAAMRAANFYSSTSASPSTALAPTAHISRHTPVQHHFHDEAATDIGQQECRKTRQHKG